MNHDWYYPGMSQPPLWRQVDTINQDGSLTPVVIDFLKQLQQEVKAYPIGSKRSISLSKARGWLGMLAVYIVDAIETPKELEITMAINAAARFWGCIASDKNEDSIAVASIVHSQRVATYCSELNLELGAFIAKKEVK